MCAMVWMGKEPYGLMCLDIWSPRGRRWDLAAGGGSLGVWGWALRVRCQPPFQRALCSPACPEMRKPLPTMLKYIPKNCEAKQIRPSNSSFRVFITTMREVTNVRKVESIREQEELSLLRDKGHYAVIKESIHLEDTTAIYTHLVLGHLKRQSEYSDNRRKKWLLAYCLDIPVEEQKKLTSPNQNDLV